MAVSDVLAAPEITCAVAGRSPASPLSVYTAARAGATLRSVAATKAPRQNGDEYLESTEAVFADRMMSDLKSRES